MVKEPDRYWIDAARRVRMLAVAHLVGTPKGERPARLFALLNNPDHPEWDEITRTEIGTFSEWRSSPKVWQSILAQARAMN